MDRRQVAPVELAGIELRVGLVDRLPRLAEDRLQLRGGLGGRHRGQLAGGALVALRQGVERRVPGHQHRARGGHRLVLRLHLLVAAEARVARRARELRLLPVPEAHRRPLEGAVAVGAGVAVLVARADGDGLQRLEGVVSPLDLARELLDVLDLGLVGRALLARDAQWVVEVPQPEPLALGDHRLAVLVHVDVRERLDVALERRPHVLQEREVVQLGAAVDARGPRDPCWRRRPWRCPHGRRAPTGARSRPRRTCRPRPGRAARVHLHAVAARSRR